MTMPLFSERYGYTKASDVIIREKITPEIQNAICSCYDKLEQLYRLEGYDYPSCEVRNFEEYLWTHFFNERLSDFKFHNFSCTDFLEESRKPWFQKLDLVEYSIKYIHHQDCSTRTRVSERFVKLLNFEFERLNFAYRIVGNEIVEITSEQEIKTIENAMDNSPRNIKMHLNSALEKYAQRPTGDYRNSIKESISAVEAFCREKTGENTLGKALKQLESKGIVIPPLLKSAFEKLYAYTNHEDTGIRHALMDDEGNYTPTAEEALFMLVSCSAFINYLRKKVQ